MKSNSQQKYALEHQDCQWSSKYICWGKLNSGMECSFTNILHWAGTQLSMSNALCDGPELYRVHGLHEVIQK